MKKIVFILLFRCFSGSIVAQINIEASPDVQSVNVGGKSQIEQVIKTQMNIHQTLLKAPDQDVIIYFTVTKDEKIQDVFFKDNYGAYYKKETRRLLNYFMFESAKKNNVNVDGYGSLTINFNAVKYKTYLKERNKYKLNTGDKDADSSFVINTVADISPEYYKGEDELKEFILANMDYPNVARNQNIEGTVQLSFVVETNGYLSNIKALKIIGGGCTDEAIRIISLTRWKPAIKGGKYVRYKTTYPITFSIKNVNHDNSASGQ